MPEILNGKADCGFPVFVILSKKEESVRSDLISDLNYVTIIPYVKEMVRVETEHICNR